MSDKPKLLHEGKRPYYDSSVLSNKRNAEKSALLEALKTAFGFGTALIVNNNRSITSHTQQRDKRDKKNQ